jgi:cytoskeletal protein CcmA (bactofilin family)
MKAASTIGAKTVVIGSVHGDGDLELYGRVEGDITVEGNVLIAATAKVKGTITASAIRVAGAVEGNLHASETVAIEPDARVLGDLMTPRISIAEGATVQGMVRTEPAPKKDAQRAAEPRTPDPVRPPAVARPVPVVLPPPERISRAQDAMVPPVVAVEPLLPLKQDKDHRDRRPPEPRVPTLAKGTKGKKKGDKRSR